MSIFFIPFRQPEVDSENRIVHGMWKEDFQGPRILVCPYCGPWSKGDYDRYKNLILHYHGFDLTAKEQEQGFMVWFSGQPIASAEGPLDKIQKLLRWNKAREEFSEERGH